jgi:hypothetical protein
MRRTAPIWLLCVPIILLILGSTAYAICTDFANRNLVTGSVQVISLAGFHAGINGGVYANQTLSNGPRWGPNSEVGYLSSGGHHDQTLISGIEDQTTEDCRQYVNTYLLWYGYTNTQCTAGSPGSDWREHIVNTCTVGGASSNVYKYFSQRELRFTWLGPSVFKSELIVDVYGASGNFLMTHNSQGCYRVGQSVVGCENVHN